jgi:hypothetical protein
MSRGWTFGVLYGGRILSFEVVNFGLPEPEASSKNKNKIKKQKKHPLP